MTSLQLRECYVRNIYIWLHNIFWSYISSIRIHPVIVECKFLQNLQIFTILLQIWIYNIVHTCMYVLTVLSYILLCVIISCITSVILWNQYLSARTHGIPRTLSIWSVLYAHIAGNAAHHLITIFFLVFYMFHEQNNIYITDQTNIYIYF